MGSILSTNGLTVQIQRRADQEAFLKAFWEFREACHYQFHNGQFAADSVNNFESPGAMSDFDACTCGCPEVFYPEHDVMEELDPQCLMKDREIATLWKNLHQSFDTVWDMLTKFDVLRAENLAKFRVHYLKFNEHGAIDLLTWTKNENKLFVLYCVVYLTFYPDSEGYQGMLESFETPEGFKDFLEGLEMEQFVKLSPLLRIFYRMHSFDIRKNFFDAENDFENMIDFFFKRSYYKQISETRFNVYTAAVVYSNSMMLNNFGEKRRRDLEQMEQRRSRGKGARKENKGIFMRNKHAAKVATTLVTAAAEADKVMDKAYAAPQPIYDAAADAEQYRSAAAAPTAPATGATEAAAGGAAEERKQQDLEALETESVREGEGSFGAEEALPPASAAAAAAAGGRAAGGDEEDGFGAARAEAARPAGGGEGGGGGDPKKPSTSFAQTAWQTPEQLLENAMSKHSIPPRMSVPRDEKKRTRIGKKYLEPRNPVGKFLNWISHSQEIQDRYQSDYKSAIQKSIVCSITQLSMYIGLLALKPSTHNWEDDTSETDMNVRHFVNMTIIVFTYMYCSNMATTECYIHSLTVFQAMNRRMGKFLVSVNFIINTIMVSTMIFSTAVVLKRSAVTVMDIVLNSTAIYFIADLDDMMISSTDEEILDERILFTYIYHLIDLSKKVDKGEICQFLKEERWWIIFQHYGMIALLGFSFYIYFGSNFPSWMESGPLSN